MAFNLVKGEKVSLSKQNPGLKKIRIGLSWDMKPGVEADLDASVLLLNNSGKLVTDTALVFYNNLTSFDESVQHAGDNRTGSGDGDDEVITIDLVKTKADTILIAITSYAAPTAEAVIFGRVKNATVKLYDDEKNEVLYVFDLTEDMSNATAMEMAKIYKHNGEWKYAALGEKAGTSKNGLEDIVNKYS